MLRVLHAGCVQLGSWYEWPTVSVPLDLEERIDAFGRLQVVDVAVLEKIWFSGGFLCHRTFVVCVFGRTARRIGRLSSHANMKGPRLLLDLWLAKQVQLVPMLNPVFALAAHTSGLATRYFRHAREGVALSARP